MMCQKGVSDMQAWWWIGYLVIVLIGFLCGALLGQRFGLRMTIDMLKMALGEQFEYVEEDDEEEDD